MNDETAAQLVEINHQFYQSCARSFSKTRRRIQPGVKKTINSYLRSSTSYQILDIGCGNGELVKVISENGVSGAYLGVDFSAALINEFIPINERSELLIRWFVRNLLNSNWSEDFSPQSFDRIFCFAVLHHIPGFKNQTQILQNIRKLLKPDGVFIFSVWQFLSSQKLVQRIQSWDRAGINRLDVDDGDYLLDWRAEGRQNCLRYIHHYSIEKLEEMRIACGYKQLEQFLSDGNNDQLGLYNIWQPE